MTKYEYQEQLIDPHGVVRCTRTLFDLNHESWINHVTKKWEGWSRKVVIYYLK